MLCSLAQLNDVCLVIFIFITYFVCFSTLENILYLILGLLFNSLHYSVLTVSISFTNRHSDKRKLSGSTLCLLNRQVKFGSTLCTVCVQSLTTSSPDVYID